MPRRQKQYKGFEMNKKAAKQLKNERWVLGIDPGLSGAFVLTNGEVVEVFKMPINKSGKDQEVSYIGVYHLLSNLRETYFGINVYLERAVSFGMGTKSAFNYGRGFAAIEIAIHTLLLPVTYVEPQKWTKQMHQGISADLKPKAKSLVAVNRLFPKLVKQLPTNTKGALLDGPVDALLIAAWGLRLNETEVLSKRLGDFY